MDTLLENLPAECMATIAEYVPFEEDYEDTDYSRHETDGRAEDDELQLKLKHGFALAVCSKGCHKLLEDAAAILVAKYTEDGGPFLCADTSASSPFHNHANDEDDRVPKGSILAQFYRYKEMEFRARYHQRRLHEMTIKLKREFSGTIGIRIRREGKLLDQVKRVVEGPLVQSSAKVALEDCIAACAEALRVRVRARARGMHWRCGSRSIVPPNPATATATKAAVILHRIIEYLYKLDGDSHELLTCGFLLLYLAKSTKDIPNIEGAHAALDHLFRRPLLEIKLPFTQTVLSLCLNYLFSSFSNTQWTRMARSDRTILLDSAYGFCQRYRENTLTLDPAMNLVAITNHINREAQNGMNIGRERSLQFIRASVDMSDQISDPKTAFQWSNKSHDATDQWEDCKGDLRDLLTNFARARQVMPIQFEDQDDVLFHLERQIDQWDDFHQDFLDDLPSFQR